MKLTHHIPHAAKHQDHHQYTSLLGPRNSALEGSQMYTVVLLCFLSIDRKFESKR